MELYSYSRAYRVELLDTEGILYVL